MGKFEKSSGERQQTEVVQVITKPKVVLMWECFIWDFSLEPGLEECCNRRFIERMHSKTT